MSRNPIKASKEQALITKIKELEDKIDQLKFNQNSKISTTFTTVDGKTITVVEGIIVSVV